MFKKLLSVSLIFLIAVSGLSSVYSEEPPEQLILSGCIGDHYSVSIDDADDCTAQSIIDSEVSWLKLSRYLTDDGVILHPYQRVSKYGGVGFSGYELVVSFYSGPYKPEPYNPYKE